MRFALAMLLLAAGPGRSSQLWDVLKSAEIDAMLAKTQQSVEVLAKSNYAVVLRVSTAKSAAWQTHPEADEFWFVRRGAGKLSLGGSAQAGSGQQYDMAVGDIVYVPRDKAYQIAPGSGRFEYVAVRVYPAERHVPRSTPPRPMATVVTKAQIDDVFANAEKNTPLHSVGAAGLNQILYWVKNPQGPDGVDFNYEVHLNCDQLYFKRVGNAQMHLDGTLVNMMEKPPGELRAPGVTGDHVLPVGPGDIVSIPRNTVHKMDPGSAKLGYVLVAVCE